MKIKIRETLNTIVPKYVYTGRKNIFNLNITDKFKYLILPVRITSPTTKYNKDFLLFYSYFGTILFFDFSFKSTKCIILMRIEPSIAILAACHTPLLGRIPAVTQSFANGHNNEFDDGVYSLF